MYTVGLDKLDSLILYSQHKKTKGKIKNIFVSSETKEIIFGSLLGDAKLELSARSLNARFGFIQAESKRDYFISVLNHLACINSGKYREYSYIDKRTNKTYKNLNFWSKALPMLNEFYEKFYKGKVKIVPSDLSLLTPLALAHWVAQKGKLNGKGLYICTDNFDYTDIKRLTKYLTHSYNIKCTVHRVKGRKHRIYILPKSVQTLNDIILPYL